MMFSLTILRKLFEYQQYTELKIACENYLAETSDVQILPLLALAHSHLGEQAAALLTLKETENLRTQLDTNALVDLAAVYIVMFRLDEAVETLEKALTEKPNHGLAMARLGLCAMHQGELERAQHLFERSVRFQPELIPVYLHLSRLHLQQQEAPSAQRVLNDAINRLNEIHPELPEFVVKQYTAQLRHLQLECWAAGGRFAEAEEWLAVKRNQVEPDTWIDLLKHYGTLLTALDHHAQAEEILRDGLNQFPKSIALHHQLAELARLQGRFIQAANILHRAIRLSAEQGLEDPGLWVKLSNAYLHQFDEKAREAAEKAVGLADILEEDDTHPAQMIRTNRLQAKTALARVESHEHHFDTADRLFREVLDENPYFLPALQGLGQQQMQRGNIDEAIRLFERIKTVDPARGYSSLITARQFPEDLETLERMEKITEQPGLEGSFRSGMMFPLAAAWEKRGEYERAFACAEKANASVRKHLRYDSKAHRNYCARIRMSFCKELYEHRKECGVYSTLPVFVLGMPRSGTTLVEQILSGHSQIFGAGELGVIPRVIQGLNRWERHVGSGRAYPDCIDDLTPHITAGIAEKLLKELKEFDPEARHILDKLPHNFENIGLIKFLFPKAKIISVRRDPRDIAISNYFTDYQARHGGMGFAYDLTEIGEQLADHNLLMHHWHQLFPGEILEIHYEDVVENLEDEARKMLDYIGVEWEKQVLAFNELDRPVKTASVWQVRQPIYNTAKARWVNYRNHLAPLTKGTNARIEPDPITDMITLPEPGFLTHGVELFKKGDLDGAELSFKKMLHHNPEHAACNYMVGLIYLNKGHIREGIGLIEKALEKAPWHKEWRENLEKAYETVGDHAKAEVLKAKSLQRNGKISDDLFENLENTKTAEEFF